VILVGSLKAWWLRRRAKRYKKIVDSHFNGND